MSSKKPNKSGGGSNTNENGLSFEQTTSLESLLVQADFKIENAEVYFGEQMVGWSLPQAQIYSKFLEPRGINYKDYNSKGWRPDECFINEKESIVYIIEKNFRTVVVRLMKN